MLKFGGKGDASASFQCTVRLLEDTEVVECEFQAHHKGKYLLEYVCRQLNLIEKDYFGLRYVDSNKQRHWLDPAKTVIKQVKDMDRVLFSFRVKFYPPDPFRLKEEITRYQVFLQLRRDMLHGRLYCTAPEAALLGAYLIQGDLGDYDPEEHEGNYITEHKLLLKQTLKIEEDIMELHQTQMRGQSPETTETNFLRKAFQLDTYGVDPHPVKDHRGNQLYLGINHSGILTLQGTRKTHHFRWNEVQKINYEGKMFIVHLSFNEDPRTKKKHTVGFKCQTSAACRHIWRCAVEQMLFFTLPSSSEAPTVVTGGSFFSWGTKFRYSGRTEREIQEEIGPLRRDEPPIKRTSSLRRKASSVPATPSTPVGTELGEIRYGSLPRANHSAPDTRLDSSGLLSGVDLSSPYCPDSTLPLLETVAEDQEMSSKPRAEDEAQENKMVTNATLSEHENSDTTPAILISDESNQIIKTEAEIKAEAKTGNNVKNINGISEKKGSLKAVKDPKINQMLSKLLGKEDGYETGAAPGYGEYYFRDSFDHSSSESQLDVGGRGSSMAGTREGLALQPHTGVPPTPVPVRSFNLLHVFVPSFLLVAIVLATVLIVVLESDSELLSGLRGIPEMVILRQEYYEPAKDYLRQKLGNML